MSCLNSTSPINIEKTSNICELKCDLMFSYINSSTNITNKGNYLLFSYDKGVNPPVIYNANKYDVQEIRLYSPSLHTFQGKQADAELIVVHNNVSGSNGNLLVCIPIIKNDNVSKTSDVIGTIVKNVSKLAQNKGEKVTVSNIDFNLNDFVPMKPFYNYTGTLPYAPCNGLYNFIVFDKNLTSASISNKDHKLLEKILVDVKIPKIRRNKKVYYNPKGPRVNKDSDDIYIECNPTGDDGEILIKQEKESKSMTLEESDKVYKTIQTSTNVVLGILIMYGIIKTSRYVFKKI